jgi:hypothetical protein
LPYNLQGLFFQGCLQVYVYDVAGIGGQMREACSARLL